MDTCGTVVLTRRWIASAIVVQLALALFVENPVVAQIGFRNNPQQGAEELFLPPPRGQSRLLREAQDAIKEKRYTEGVSALAQLLQMESVDEDDDESATQDYFIERVTKKGLISKTLRGEASKLLGTLPEEGRKTLEIQYGVKASQELKAAIAARDFGAIESVARRFVHTEAGNDATVLIAQLRLADGQPLAAANLLQTLLEFPSARDRFGIQLAQLGALAFRQAGQKSVAVELLKRAATYFPNAELKAGKSYKLSEDVDFAEIVSNLPGAPLITANVPVEEWMTGGGTMQRNAVSTVGMPLANARWIEKNHGSLKEREGLTAVSEDAIKTNNIILPKLEVRCVNDLVLSKTTDAAIFARDFETGRLQWVYYFHKGIFDLTDSFSGGSTNDPAADVTEDMKNRVWGSSAYGNFSCDRDRLYLVNEEKQISARDLARRMTTERSNLLEGISLAKEGSLSWQVGGERSDAEPKLKDAFFLGPPLPYRGNLYVLAEVNDTTYLVVLDAATGAQQWRQQLLQTSVVSQDPLRRSLALAPSISDGMILCPTGCGAIVAVDLLTHSLRWARTYTSSRSIAAQDPFMRGDISSSYSALEQKWHEPFIIANQGVMITTPPESELLVSCDILTGESKLKKDGDKRGNGRYILGTTDSMFVVAANAQVIAYQFDGSIAWELAYPKGHILAGKGIWMKDSMLIPLSGQMVIKVDFQGKLVESATVDAPLGNLFAYKKQLLSVSPIGVAAYYTKESLETEVAQRISTNPNDTWALNRQSQLLVAQGKSDEAIAMLEKSFKIDDKNADTRFLLVENLLAAFEKDFEKYQPLAVKYDSVFEDSQQRFRYLQCLAKGNVKNNRYVEAFEQLIEMTHDRLNESFSSQQRSRELLKLATDHSVDSDAWIIAQIGRTYEQASPADKRKMDVIIASELEAIQRSVPTIKRQRLRYLAWLPIVAPELIALASELMEQETCVAERLLQPVLIVAEKKQQDAASEILLKGPIEEWLLLGRAGSGVIAEERQSKVPMWSNGQLELVPLEASAAEPFFWSVSETPVLGPQNRFGRPPISVRYSAPNLNIYNQNGVAIGGRYMLDRGTGDNGEPVSRSHIEGGMILAETATELLAVDMFSERQKGASRRDQLRWRFSLQSPAAGPSREVMPPPTAGSEQTPFGFSLPKRSMLPAVVGPITPTGVLVQVGASLSMLDLLGGNVIWTRDGFSDQTRFAHQGTEVAIIDSSTAKISVLDCRDGTELRNAPFKGNWRYWFSRGPNVIEYSVENSGDNDPLGVQGDNPVRLRVMNVITNQEVQNLSLPSRSLATAVGDRYLVVLEPIDKRTGKLHFLDLETGLYQTHEVSKDPEVDSIQGMISEDRVVVFCFYAKYSDNSASARNNKQALSRECIAGNGMVYSLQATDGSLTWKTPGSIKDFWIPIAQPSTTPFVAAYSTLQSGRVTLAILDMRDGSIAHLSTVPLLRTGDIRTSSANLRLAFYMRTSPVDQSIMISLPDRQLRFVATENPRSPQPIFWFSAPNEKRTTKNIFDIGK